MTNRITSLAAVRAVGIFIAGLLFVLALTEAPSLFAQETAVPQPEQAQEETSTPLPTLDLPKLVLASDVDYDETFDFGVTFYPPRLSLQQDVGQQATLLYVRDNCGLRPVGLSNEGTVFQVVCQSPVQETEEGTVDE